ncbi:ankyrin repeat-containing domain protein [Aspergillus heterothallicus]
MAGRAESAVTLLQLPLSEFPSALTLRAALNHLLAKAYFSIGDLYRAIDHCKLGYGARKKALGHHHPLFLESTEFLVHLFRATDRITIHEDLRAAHLLPYQLAYLRQIDDLEVAFTISNEAALGPMTDLLATLKQEDPTPATSLLERLGNFSCWEFEVEALGFDTRVSLLTILADLEDYERLFLLAIRGNVARNPSPGRTRPVLDTLLRNDAFSGDAETVQMLVEIGADIESSRDSLHNWRGLGSAYDSMTPLHLAANKNHLAVVEILAKNGANKEARDAANNTPLMLADQNANTDVVELLLEHGASIE